MRKLLTGLSAALMALASVPAWASTPTTNYGWLMPTVGADSNVWGTDLNNDLAGIDSIVFGMCPKTGCAFTGPVTFQTPNAGSSGAIKILANPTSGNGFLQALDPTGASEWGHFQFNNGSASWSGAFTVGALTDSGETVTGAISVSGGVTSSGIVDALTPNSGTTGGFRLRANATTGIAYEQITNSSAGSQYGAWAYNSGGNANWGGSLTVGGLLTANAGINTTSLSANAGLTVSGGSVSLPSGSISSAALASTVGAGACGSTTATCAISVNAQGQVTSIGQFAMLPDNTSANTGSGFWVSPQGVAHQWFHYDCGSTTCWNGSAQTITFPYTPAHGCYAYQATTDNQGNKLSPQYGLQVVSAPGGHSVTVSAIGYASGGQSNIEGFYVTADCF